MKHTLLLVAASLVLGLLSPLVAHASTPEQIFLQVSSSVVVVEVFDATGKSMVQGSGIVIGARQVITNCHVAQKGNSLQVRQSGKTFTATLQYADPDRDLCQLDVLNFEAIDGSKLQAPAVVLGTVSKLRVGQRVYAVGSPKGLDLTLTEGLISGLRPYEGSQYIQTSAAISPGSSGGGLFDDQGRLIGITTFQIVEGQNLNFALPVDWISDLPKRSQVASTAKKSGLDLFNRAMALFENNDWAGLLVFSKQWVESEPKNAYALQFLGNANFFLGNRGDAIQAYRKALLIRPKDWIIWNQLGSAYSHSKQYDQAIQAYWEAVRIQPEDFVSWSGLGDAYNDLQQYDKAIQACREAVRLQPVDFVAWNTLGDAYANLKQYDQAVQAYREVVRLRPDYATAWYNLGLVYYFQGQHDKVREIHQILRKVDPSKADKYFNNLILP